MTQGFKVYKLVNDDENKLIIFDSNKNHISTFFKSLPIKKIDEKINNKKKIIKKLKIAEKIKSNDLEYLETELKHNRKYFEDYFTGFEKVDSFKELIDDDEFDIDEYVEVYEKEFFRLKNTVYLINTGYENYNLTLDGKQVPKNHCPNCNNAVKEFNFSDFDKCPNCGGARMLFRIGADYD